MKDYCNHSKLDLRAMKDQIYAGLLSLEEKAMKINFKDDLWNQKRYEKAQPPPIILMREQNNLKKILF